MTTETTAQTLPFQAEVSRLLHLVVHSLYSHPEIFLRELVSNASDAIDRLRLLSLTDSSVVEEDEDEQSIQIIADEDGGTVTLTDSGVGMTREELIQNLGTIAHSGTLAFLEGQKDKGDSRLIGQFGVGFYSAFLVADRVDVFSRAPGAESVTHHWCSDAQSSFTVEELPADHARSRSSRGTTLVLHLKSEQKEFAQLWKLRQLVTKYSDFVSHPIFLSKVGDAEPTRANQATALWRRRPAEVQPEQYEEFYKHLTHDWETPAARIHFHVEGNVEFTALLFLPTKAPFDLFHRDAAKNRGVKLFVRRVFIMDDCEELVPLWLRFVKGVVDSDDLPLNVSRELLQDSATVRTIRKNLARKALEMLGNLATERPADYDAAWLWMGAVLKEGLAGDGADQKDTLADLLRYRTSNDSGLTSLKDYVGRMKEGQKGIYYVLGESEKSVAASPHLEALRKHGFEVLYMSDPVDEFALEQLREYDGKPLVSAMKADLDLPEDAEDVKKKEEHEGELGALLARMKEVLKDHVSDVRVSTRLVDSPCCLVVPEGGQHAFVERLMRAYDKDMPKQKRILEVHGGHPVIRNLSELQKLAGQEGRVDAWIELLFDQVLLSEGSPVEDPSRLARRVTELLLQVSGAALSSQAAGSATPAA